MIKQLVQRIKAERIRQKVTMEELVLKSGVSQKHISNIENEKAVPTLETLEKLAKPLGLEINVRLDASKCPKPQTSTAVDETCCTVENLSA